MMQAKRKQSTHQQQQHQQQQQNGQSANDKKGTFLDIGYDEIQAVLYRRNQAVGGSSAANKDLQLSPLQHALGTQANPKNSASSAAESMDFADDYEMVPMVSLYDLQQLEQQQAKKH